MSSTSPSAIDDVVAEHQGLELQLADPALHNDPAAARRVGKRFAELAPVMATYRKLTVARDDLEAARELAADDASFAEEIPALEEAVAELDATLTDLLAPRDPHDGDDVVMEIKSGAGGEESALFASDLARMYLKYCERHGWKAQILGVTESDLGGYKEATISVKARESVRDGVWSRLKFEGGVHRVQRVPVTESQGRIHTSAAGVLIYPEPDEVEEVSIDESDLRIDVYRSSGKGGQGVNTTDSAVRVTHFPSGIVVTCQNERSQIQNKAACMQILKARLYEIELEKRAEALDEIRGPKTTIGFGNQIRSYVLYPYQMVKDLRTGVETSNVEAVLDDGDLDPFVIGYHRWATGNADAEGSEV